MDFCISGFSALHVKLGESGTDPRMTKGTIARSLGLERTLVRGVHFVEGSTRRRVFQRRDVLEDEMKRDEI